METVTVTASRAAGFSEMEVLIGSAIVIVLVAWMAFSGMRSLRSRHGAHQPSHQA